MECHSIKPFESCKVLKIIHQKYISSLVTTSAYLMSNKANWKTNNTQKDNRDKVFYYISNVPCDQHKNNRKDNTWSRRELLTEGAEWYANEEELLDYERKTGRQRRCELRERREFNATLCRWSKNVVVAVWREKKGFNWRPLSGHQWGPTKSEDRHTETHRGHGRNNTKGFRRTAGKWDGPAQVWLDD